MTMLLAAQRTLDFGRSRLGTLEEPVNRCEFNRWYYDADISAAWCATGVSWSLSHGCDGVQPVPASTSKGFAYVPSGVTWAKNHGAWLPNVAGRWVGEPGDLTVFSFGGVRPDHVELLEARGDRSGTYVDIGFNTLRPGAGGDDRSGGGVWRRVRNSKIIGFIRPPYPADQPPQPQPPIPGALLMEAFYIVRFGNSPGRFAWWPSINRKAFISGDAMPGFVKAKGYSGELLLEQSDVDGIKNLGDK